MEASINPDKHTNRMTTMKRNTDSIQVHEFLEVKDYSEIMGINLKSRARDRLTVWARYAVWLYLMEECGAKIMDISRHFGWHHATIIYGVEQIKEKLQINDGLALEQALHIYRADPHERRQIQKGRARAGLKWQN